jgi:hypothetical protein
MKINLRKAVVPIVLLLACVALGIIMINFVVRFAADRQPASISDIPIYPHTFSVQYGDKPHFLAADMGLDGCPSLSFATLDGEAAIQKFYEVTLLQDDTILKRGWVGDGALYPEREPISFYRKGRGMMQRAEITTTRAGNETHVTIHLCNQK